MDFCSYFIDNKSLFGSYPSNEQVEILEEMGVIYFIDLTCDGEKVVNYQTKMQILKYPIKDRGVPTNIREFCKFIIQIGKIIKNDKNIYIHCRGGHGRAGLLVACLLCYLYKYSPQQSLLLTNQYHNNRTEMRNIWRKIGSPQTRVQKTFIFKLFKPLYFFQAYQNGPSAGLSNYSKHCMKLENIGVFSNSQKLYYALKYKDDKDCVYKLLNNKTFKFVLKKPNPDNWEFLKKNVMKTVLLMKIKQHPEVKNNLINTGFRKIIYNSKYNDYWGIGSGEGKNILGELLGEIREKLIM